MVGMSGAFWGNNPLILEDIHYQYMGGAYYQSNTFGGNRFKLEYGLQDR